MTRDRFICTDCSDTAPGRSARGTSVGRIAAIAGALNELPTPIAKTHATSATRDGSPPAASTARTIDSTNCSTWVMISSLRRSTTSASTPPTVDMNSNGPSCAKNRMPTNTADLVSSYPNAPSSTFCIHVPMFDANVPPQKMRKSRFRSAACAVPRRNPRSPSMIASVASSVSGSCVRARRGGMVAQP